jgi:hypothetical protein
MAPIKFDENIKEKLEGRNIQPSSEAWNKLSERLDNQKKNGSSKPYWWLGIAASIIGILLVVSQFLNNEIKVEASPKVVETPMLIKQDANTQIANEVDNSDIMKTEELEKVHETTNSTKLIINNTEEAIAVNTTEKVNKEEKDIIVKPLEIIEESLSFEDQQIKNVVAKVQSMEFDENTISDADINALLEQAQREIRLNNLINETTGVVDADALLQDVEADLDQSFRTKVFEALKLSFKSVKTAVAQRND